MAKVRAACRLALDGGKFQAAGFLLRESRRRENNYPVQIAARAAFPLRLGQDLHENGLKKSFLKQLPSRKRKS